MEETNCPKIRLGDRNLCASNVKGCSGQADFLRIPGSSWVCLATQLSQIDLMNPGSC